MIEHRIEFARRSTQYLWQRVTRSGIDSALERRLKHESVKYLTTSLERKTTPGNLCSVQIESLNLDDRSRYSVFRDDIYKRFVANENGLETDVFGRKGEWVPRGCVTYFDCLTNNYVKVFDEYFCQRGEGKFLADALNFGLYDFLCPGLSYVIVDKKKLIRGYAIREGKPLTKYEFARYISGSLRDLICCLTERSGLYFYDLTFHNVIKHGRSLSLIDIESVLPVDWFRQSDEFSVNHFSDIDIGWSIQKKWHSPKWYWKFLVTLTSRP